MLILQEFNKLNWIFLLGRELEIVEWNPSGFRINGLVVITASEH